MWSKLDNDIGGLKNIKLKKGLFNKNGLLQNGDYMNFLQVIDTFYL